MKHSFLLCLFAAAVPLRAIPAPMQVTAATPARVWTEGYGTGNGRLGILSFGVFPKETVVLNEGSIFAKKNFQMREGAAEALDKARELCKEGKYRSADQLFRKNILPPATLRGITSRGASSGGIPGASLTFLLSAYAGYAAGKATTRAQFGTGN
ncbi:MAG: glycoside hydrolase N-terminal domain-containing protein [Akkermansia sp.]